LCVEEIDRLRQRVQELIIFKSAYLEQVELHNKTLDELASALVDLDREVRIGNDYLQRINELEEYARNESKRTALIDRLMNRISELECKNETV
jgi:hypothetical protein